MKRLGERLWTWVFRLIPASSYGAMRIALGLLLVGSHLLLWPELDLLLGPDGVVSLQALDKAWTPYRFSVYDLARSSTELHLLHGLGLGILLAFTLGLQTRWTSWLSLLVLVSLHHRDPWIQNGGDRVLRIMTFYLALCPSGRALSLDAWRHARRMRRLGLLETARPLAPAFVLHLIQAQLLLVYAWTGLAKTSGSTWRAGSALYYALSDENYGRAPAFIDRVLATDAGQLLATLGTWATLGWELLFVPLVLWPRTRLLALVLGVLVHGGIWLSMSVGVFSFAMTWGYLAFIDPRWVERRLHRA